MLSAIIIGLSTRPNRAVDLEHIQEPIAEMGYLRQYARRVESTEDGCVFHSVRFPAIVGVTIYRWFAVSQRGELLCDHRLPRPFVGQPGLVLIIERPTLRIEIVRSSGAK